ncbi:hypothetical protein [Spongiibacter tropicus]|uniref:hypothetical protein n=1 Tax=Spongiibacter tropicus TaxID=454602 RepID=UPI0003B4918E|nr:hypothetical protein [Spongiibacter tropicus]
MSEHTETETRAEASKSAVEPVVSRPTAWWTVELNCDCPDCKAHVDLLDYPDFWDGRQLDIPEHDTERSTATEVVCPECGHDFEVDLAY